MNNEQLDDYADFLANYLKGTYEEYINFEYVRESTEIDWYKADKLLLVYNIIQDCNSFFIQNIKSIDDVKKYVEYIQQLHDGFKSEIEDDNFINPQLFVLGMLLSPLLTLK